MRTVDRILLACGAAYALAFVVANDLVAAATYDGYSRLDQAVSELSAIGAPPRLFLQLTTPLFTALLVGFGVGIWRSGRHALGAVVAAHGLIGVAWLFFPMSSRADMVPGETSANDLGHLVLTGLTVLLITAMIGLSAVTFGGWFRAYASVTVVVVMVAGMLAGRASAGIAEGDPTPWLGLLERTCIGGWLIWLAVVFVGLLRGRGPFATGRHRSSEPRRAAARRLSTTSSG